MPAPYDPGYDDGYPAAPGYDPSAEYALPSFADLLAPDTDPLATIGQVRRDLGLPGAQPPARRQAGPDVTGLAEHLGLR
jgi:hypothetical protein